MPQDLALFSNLQTNIYWSGTELELPPNPIAALAFDFSNGGQTLAPKGGQFFGWAVRPGDVSAVPEPSTMFLLGSGLVGLIGYRMKKVQA